MRKTVTQALEGLERRVIEGFERVDRRLDGIDGRLDGVDGRLDGIDGRLDGHDGRFERIDRQFLEVARRFDAVDASIAAVDTKVEGLRVEMYSQFDAVYQRLDRPGFVESRRRWQKTATIERSYTRRSPTCANASKSSRSV